MKLNTLVVGAVLTFVAGALPLAAHHSFAAEYDSTKKIDITGTVTKIEWMNPHPRFYVDVKNANGTVTNWNFELAAIPVLLKQGWHKNALKVGDQVSVEGFVAKDASNLASARRVILPDGRKVFTGSASDGTPGAPQQ